MFVRWNTGVDLFGLIGSIDWSIAALSGTLSAATIQPEKDIPQFTAKLTCCASSALSLTINGFVCPYLTEIPRPEPPNQGYASFAAATAGEDPDEYLNLGSGLGIHFDCGYFEPLSEGFGTRWDHPYFGSLDAHSGYADLRDKIAPQWYLAGRVETIRFSELDFGGAAGTTSWDYPLNRMQFGVGYRVDPSPTIKAVSQIVRCPDFEYLDDETVELQLSVAIR